MRRFSLMVVCAFACLHACGHARAGEPIAECDQVQRAELACGIEIVVYTQDSDADDPVQVWTRIERGSMSEGDGERGASVIAARAMMDGVGSMGREELLELFGIDPEQVFAGSRSMVMGDHVAFMLGVDAAQSAEGIMKGLRLARGLVDGYQPSDEAIESARRAVIDELGALEDERPEQRAYRRWFPEMMGESAYGNLPTPSRDECADLDPDAVRGFVHREWTPGQAIVIVVGNVDPGKVIAQAREVFDGCVDRTQTPMCKGVMIADSTAGRIVTMHEEALDGSRLGLVYFGSERPIDWDRGGFEEVVIQSIAAEAMRYRMNRLLRRDHAGVIDARVDIGTLMGRVPFGQIVVELRSDDDGGDWASVLAGMERQRVRLMRDGLTEAELDRARDWTIQQLGYELDQWRDSTNAERARALNWMLAIGRPLVDLGEWYEGAVKGMDTLDRPRVDELIRAYFGNREPAVLVLLGSEAGTDQQTEDGSGVARVRELLERASHTETPALARDWIEHLRGPILNRSGKGGSVEEISMHQASGVVSATLSNGVVVHHREMRDREGTGTVSMCVRLGFDSIEDPAMNGAADVMVAAMERGMIRSRTEDEIRGIMIEQGITMEISRGTWGIEIALSFRQGAGTRSGADEETFERGVELVYALLRDLRIEGGLIDELASQGATGSRVLGVPIGAMEVGIARAFGKEFALRDPGKLGEEIEPRTVREWIYKRVYGGALEVGIAGAIDPQRAIEACALYLGSIRQADADDQSIGTVLGDREPGGAVKGEQTVRISDSSGREGVMIGFGGSATDALDELRALTVAGMVLDARLTELATNIDQQVSVTSGALTLDLVPGRVVMFGRVDCAPEQIGSWAAVIQGEIERMAVEGVSQDEVDDPVARIDGMLGDGFDTLGFWSRRMARLGIRGGEIESIWSIRNAYTGVDAERVNAAFGKWYRDGEHFRVEMINEER